MSPRRIGVREHLALGTVIEHEPLTVGIRGKVRSVDGYLLAHLWLCVTQSSDHRFDARCQSVGELAELGREPIAGVHRRGTSEDRLQRLVFTDQLGRARPRRQRVEGLDKEHADHRSTGVARATRPACVFQFVCQPDHLGGVEQTPNLSCVIAQWYRQNGHRRCFSLGQSRGCLRTLGSLICVPILPNGGISPPGQRGNYAGVVYVIR